MPNLGSTQYYQTSSNGTPIYVAATFAGNTPYGYTPISGDQYAAGLQSAIKDPSLGATPQYNTINGQNFSAQQALDAYNAKTGPFAANYINPTYANFQPNAPTPSSDYFTPQAAAQNAVDTANYNNNKNNPSPSQNTAGGQTVTSSGLPTLANGQTAGGLAAGLQMPSGANSNTVFDPISGKQVSPSEAAFNATQASGKAAPQTAAEATPTVKAATASATPPPPAPSTPTTTPNVDNFFASNPSLQQSMTDLQTFLNPPETTKQLNDQLAKITADNATLAGLNTQEMSLQTVMNGTADDLRKEIQATGGMATESQVQALAVARNKTLLQQANLIQNQITTAQNALNADTTLFQNEKELATTQFSQRSTIYQLAQQNQQQMQQAAKDGANTIIQAIGLQGYLQSLQAQGPNAVTLGEKVLGLSPGGLQQLAQAQQEAQNRAAYENSGATTPFVNKNGEIQSQTGYAYTSEQDFYNKTGMTIQQAQSKGLVSTLQPSLDVQTKQAQLAKAQADLANAPLETQKLKAEIASANASTAKTLADIAGSTGNAAQQKLEQQYREVLVKEVSSRSGTVGTEDAKVAQANHLASLLNQYYDPKTGNYNVPQAQYGELVLGLAGMLSKTGTPTDNQVDNITTKTAKGDLAGAITYITGAPQNGSTQAVIKNLADSISRQAQTAEQNRQAGVNVLRGLKPTDLEESRAEALEQATLVPYTGIKGIDQGNQTLSPTAPLPVGSTGTFSNGVTWKIIQ